MEIIKVETGYLEENCYIISDGSNCLVVDPGDDIDKIILGIDKLTVLGVLITHHHFDHVGALKSLLDKYPVLVYDFNNCEEKKYTVGSFTFEVIYNPGHSKDSVSFYFPSEKKMFVGDFIFYRNIGRCDLEGGSFMEMKMSIARLKRYNDDIILYPGHGNETTLLKEKQHNLYFNGK